MANDLVREINAVARLEGSFLLRSGQRSSHYFDKYRFEADPGLLRRIASRMLGLVPPETQVLAGLELGGVPIATAMSLESGLPDVPVLAAFTEADLAAG
jgi:orotate phosphoribosyltransferase